MHVLYTKTGPTEIGQSKAYESIEIQADFEDGVVYLVGQQGEEWHTIAELCQFDGELQVTSKDKPELDLGNVISVWIDPE